jgi:phosphate:Na+ symporter
MAELQSDHDRLKANLIIEGTRAHISIAQMSATIDCLAEALRFGQQWSKGMTRLQKLQEEIESLGGTSQAPTITT